ncbi:polysaccharide biosynthesis tyrosine autokinase [Arthrobacter sp. zg-Y820]|nr:MULTISPECIES: polysaccharide biosynthesis tyrosine autokinase [unclassified Arthrobacter]MDK1280865.1 polysaccharide biosynthesis tyrosine autokinase [Arthrobacter sp. zg.Y820]MDK1360171.1 polysaccharide biosynthesis tyrosine autokinase [Arthrobacter sp. zg-Y1219]WIB10344.1 polysaccharide biosynthesis tyrosine autokinase [Arthrobacter sp. zg-Y820]
MREQILILRRNWMLIVSFALIGLITAGVISVLMPKTYTATSSLFVSTQNGETTVELQQGSAFSLNRVQSYVELVTKPQVLNPVIDSLELDMSPQELATKIKPTTSRNTVLIDIEVADSSAQRAADIANGVVASLISSVADLERPTNGLPSPMRLTSVDTAEPPSAASSPKIPLNLALGLLYGLALGLVVAILRHVLDRHVRTEADLRKSTPLPLLGGITESTAPRQTSRPTILGGSGTDAFRQLRTNLEFVAVSQQMKSLVVTSSQAGEGKSTVALNLALSIAQSGQRVILVDADLRLPSVANATGLEGGVGLTTVLIGRTTLAEATQHWGSGGLSVLTSGPLPPNPTELLGSETMQNLIEELEAEYDMVILDAPPVLPVADAPILTRHTDGILLVVGATRVSQHNLSKAVEQLSLVNANVVGVVLNRIPRTGPDANTAYLSDYGVTPLPVVRDNDGGAASPVAEAEAAIVRDSEDTRALSKR